MVVSGAGGLAIADPRLVIVEENDALAAKRDFGYTQGLRASLIFDDPLRVDVIPAVGASLGNVYTHAAVGGLVRFGQLLSATWGTTRIRPSLLGSSFFSRPDAGDLGFALFVGAEARAVARNIFLDGNTFVGGPSVKANPFVGELTAGAEVFTGGGSRIAFSITKRTAEFRGQPGRGDLFGTLEGTLRF